MDFIFRSLAAKLLSGCLCSAEQHTVLATAKKSFLTEQNVVIKPGFIRIPAPFMEKIAKFWANCILFIIFFCYHDPLTEKMEKYETGPELLFYLVTCHISLWCSLVMLDS